ncbi:MAG: hypothetical protein U9P14_10665, partial [Gemmatimonadota bacterium]|nr:hypothetical protein [Gemmatimonadota bacterium]
MFRRRMILKAIAPAVLLYWSSLLAGGGIAEITREVVTEFGTYSPVMVDATAAPNVPDPVVAGDLSNVAYLENLRRDLEGEPLEILAANHFVAVPARYKQLHDLYNRAHEMELPV